MGKGIFIAVKINVLQLGSPTGLYGAERWILALVRHLDPTKINSVVAAIKDEPHLAVPLCEQAMKLGFQTKVFTAYGKFNPSAVNQLRRFIRQKNIHILHTHGYKQDLIGLMAVMGTSCRIITTPHGWSQDAGFKLQCYETLNRLVFPFFDAVVPLSQELYDNLKYVPFLSSKLNLITNGVDTSEIEQSQSIAPILDTWQKEGLFVIGYIGQLIKRKGLETLFRAVAMLDKRIKYKLVLVGEGNQQHYLEALCRDLGIEDSVLFLGYRENRLDYLKGFDLFVLPSKLEGIPRCLMESMAAGILVLASNIPGCTDLVEDEVTGMLFHCDSPSDLCKKITKGLSREHGGNEIKKSARKMIHRRYSANAMAKNYEALFELLSS